MNTITAADIARLANEQGDWFVSIYLPTHIAGEYNQQSAARLKNLVRDAASGLEKRGMAPEDADKFLTAANELVSRKEFWRPQGKGAAILVARSGLSAWRLDDACPELVIVGRAFHLIPLIAQANHDRTYHILAISQNRVRLLRGNRHDLVEVAVPGLPQNRELALDHDKTDEAAQIHSGEVQLGGKEGMVFHGHGGEVDASKQEITTYFRMVDRAVVHHLGNVAEPLIFAGVDFLFPLYREVNTYRHLAASPIGGNPDRAATDSLRAGAWNVLAASNGGRRRAEADDYWRSATAGRSEKHLEQIVPVASDGIVETLFVDPAVQQWGLYDEATRVVRLDETRRHDSDDLVNAAAIAVLRHGGTVATLESGYIPGGGVAAAVLRYAAPALETAPSAAVAP